MKISSFAIAIFLTLPILACSRESPDSNGEETLDRYMTSPTGWKAGELEARYTPDSLHEYVNGGAERYLGYGFRELLVREYVRDGAGSGPVRVEIYRMGSPADAYGVFSSDRSGDDTGDTGVDASLGDYLLQFWQGEFFVRVQDYDLAGGLREELHSFGRLVSGLLPASGPRHRPSLLEKLPVDGLDERSVVYFHTRNSLNSLVYLGEENLLSLGRKTGAVYAEYSREGVFLACLLVHYPSDDQAARAYELFRKGEEKIPAGSGLEISTHGLEGEYIVLVLGDDPPPERAGTLYAQTAANL